MEKFLGVDFGGTNIKLGLVGKKGGMTGKKKYPTKDISNNIVEGFIQILNIELDKYPFVQKIGIGIPGAMSRDRSKIIEAPNVPQLSGVDLKGILLKSFPDKEFHLENDANAAALGELYFSHENLPDSFIFVTLGTGVGGAVILDRKIFVGADGNAMELGHIISSNGQSVEQRIGKKGLVKMAFTEIANSSINTNLINKFPLSSKYLETCAQKGDIVAQKVFEKAGTILGEALVSAIRLFDIKTLVIGGGVADNFDFMKESICSSLKNHLTAYYLDNIKLVKASLENDAGIIGAASLCF